MNNDTIHIVGGGIIGLCTAWYLSKEGFNITVIDKNDFTDGTSYGNAGMIVPSHFVPMSAPGVVSQGLKWMLNKKSPFYIRPRLDTDLIQWLWHFARSANSSHVTQSIRVLHEINERSKSLYKDIAATDGYDIKFEEKGLLMLYKTRKQEKEEEHLTEKAHKLGVAAEMLDQYGLKNIEPEMELDVLGGVYFPGDAHLYPDQLMTQLVTNLKKSGVSFISNTSIIDFKSKGSKIESLLTSKNNEISVQNVLLSTGCWTAQLLKKVGLKMYLQDGKGYSITLKNPNLRPHIPTILSEAKVAITPMGQDLRVGGTLELSGLKNYINRARVKGIVNSIPKYYRNLNVPYSQTTKIWQGYRPCTPDGLPYIGKYNSIENLYVGTGHGMMGLSLGAITGKLLSEIISDQKPTIDLHPFRLQRF